MNSFHHNHIIYRQAGLRKYIQAIQYLNLIVLNILIQFIRDGVTTNIFIQFKKGTEMGVQTVRCRLVSKCLMDILALYLN